MTTKNDLVEGEEICNKCNGSGFLKPKKGYHWGPFCNKCKGEGIVTWLEQIFDNKGEKHDNIN